jgi:tRNA pseudouridine13 synthase
LSALRAALFNGCLAERLHDDGSWQHRVPGEIVYDECDHVYRHVDALTDSETRYQSTGLLWGSGENKAIGPARDREIEYFGRFPEVTAPLSAYSVRMMRRPLSMRLLDLDPVISSDTLKVTFTLRRGTYATVVLREIADVVEFHARQAGPAREK